MTLTELAKQYKATISTIQRRLISWGVDRRPAKRRTPDVPYKERIKKGPRWTDEQLQEMVKLYTELDKTLEELAIIFSSSRTSISTALHKQGVTMRKTGRRGRELITDEMIDAVAKDKAAGMTWKELGKRYGYAHQYLANTAGPKARELIASNT